METSSLPHEYSVLLQEPAQVDFVYKAVSLLARDSPLPNDARVERCVSSFLGPRRPSERWAWTTAVANGWTHFVSSFCDLTDESLLRLALQLDRVEIVCHAHDALARCGDGSCNLIALLAIDVGHVGFVAWHLALCPFVDIPAMAHVAVECGSVEMLEMVLDVAQARDEAEVLDVAEAVKACAELGHADLLKWLLERIGFRVGEPVWTTTFRFEDLVKHISAMLAVVVKTPRCIDWAAEQRSLPMVEWLHAYTSQHNTEDDTIEVCTKRAMDVAASNGDLSIVKWLHRYRQEGCTSDAMDAAAANGHRNVIKWLHVNRSEGCTSRAMDEAARHGHMGVVAWLLAHRIEGNIWTAAAAAVEARHYELAERLWLTPRSLLITGQRVRDPVEAALRQFETVTGQRIDPESVAFLQYRYENDVAQARRPVMDILARQGADEKLLDSLQSTGNAQCTTDAMDGAARFGHLYVVSWLHEHRNEGCTPLALYAAVQNRDVKMVTFLVNQREEIRRWLRSNESNAALLDSMGDWQR
ncbi:hypothetical protein PINS_up009287 [Pythium insidiosum]|nr:hypothetical protein PINS_up009287 [Pythium insidiosum]